MTTEFMHDIELAWAAGFWDGEGCVTFTTNGVSGKIYPQINISQADPEVLERFKRAVGGIGNIHGPYPTKYAAWSDMFYYRVGNKSEVEAIVNLLRPLVCSIKREQMDRVLNDSGETRYYTKRLTAEEVLELIHDFNHGYSYQDLVVKYNRSYDTIVKLLSSKRKLGLVK